MKLNRRRFIIGTALAGTGLAIGLNVSREDNFPHTREGSFQPNAWLQIMPSGEVIFQLDRVEMGQGIMTAFAMMIGEELDFDPEQLTVEMAGVHPDYKNPSMGAQVTGASTSMLTSWEPLREAGATARAMLIAAAAKTWKVDANLCQTEPGFVVYQDQRLSYGELASLAAEQSAPSSPTLKTADQYRWLGKPHKRLDTLQKVSGVAQYGVDVDMPNLKTAVIVRSPVFGGSLKSFDINSIAALSGIVAVKTVPAGLAIVADSYWQARVAANTITIEWDEGPLADLTSAKIRQDQQQAIAEREPFLISNEGDVEQALSGTERRIDAEFAVPFFHHSPMEPQNATAIFRGDSMELWLPSQSPDISRATAAHYTGLDHDAITVNTTFLGGGFGRRGYVDFAGEVATIAQQLPNVPIKLMWSREDDMQHDFYRPASYHQASVSLSADNRLEAWQHTVVSNSIIHGFGVDLMSAVLPTWLPPTFARGVGRKIGDWAADYDVTIGEGAVPSYSVPNQAVGILFHDSGVPTGFWRSVAHSYTAFITETLVDEAAHLAGEDAADFRLKHLDADPRLKNTLATVMDKAQWSTTQPNRFKGIACHKSFESYVAQIVEVSLNDGTLKLEKIYCAVDCGFAVNAEIIKDQMISGIIYGLTAALKAPITIDKGRVTGSNFHDLPVLRADEIPEFEVFIVQSTEAPTGVGEISVPPIAPALGNALFAMTKHRQRELPFNIDDLVIA